MALHVLSWKPPECKKSSQRQACETRPTKLILLCSKGSHVYFYMQHAALYLSHFRYATGRVVWSAGRQVRKRFTTEAPVLQVCSLLHPFALSLLWLRPFPLPQAGGTRF